MDFCHSQEIYLANMEKKLLDIAIKTGLDAAKTAAIKVVHKTAEATGELRGNNITEKVVKAKPVSDENSRNSRNKYSPREKRRNIKLIKASIIKWKF